MKKLILFTVLLSLLNISNLWGQIELFLKDNPSVILNDTEIEVDGRETDIQVKEFLEIKNTSGEVLTLKVVRDRLVFGSSDDLLCYAGECFSTTDPEDPNIYTFPVLLIMEIDEQSEFEPGFSPGFQKFCAKHAYKIYNNADDALITTLTINFNIGMESCELSATEQPSIGKTFTLYPNPSSGAITLKNFSADSSFKLVDVLGKTWKTAHLNGEKHKIDVHDLPDGIYFYIVSDKNGFSSGAQKLVIRK